MMVKNSLAKALGQMENKTLRIKIIHTFKVLVKNFSKLVKHNLFHTF